jgi:hypothetical protein
MFLVTRDFRLQKIRKFYATFERSKLQVGSRGKYFNLVDVEGQKLENAEFILILLNEISFSEKKIVLYVIGRCLNFLLFGNMQ